MKKNIVTVIYKYINKKHNNEELLKDLNELIELYPKDKKKITEFITEINKIMASTLLDIERDSKIEELILKSEYNIETAKTMSPMDVANMIGDLFYLECLPAIDQEYFDEMVDACVENDEKEYAWRLALNYDGKIDMDKIETYFIDIKDSYYLAELISIQDNPNYSRITTKLINSKDKELIQKMLSKEYIEFPDALKTKLEKFIKD